MHCPDRRPKYGKLSFVGSHLAISKANQVESCSRHVPEEASGPATAAALAGSKGERGRAYVTPGVLLGNLGNAVATFAALALLSTFRAIFG